MGLKTLPSFEPDRWDVLRATGALGPRKKRDRWPTQDELPSEDDEPMETTRHRDQMILLIHPLNRWLRRQGIPAYVSGNNFIYFHEEQVEGRHFRGPDFYVVMGADPDRERKSWVVWEEGKGPDVVIELLSEATARFDRGAKKLVYQNGMKVREYFWFDPWKSSDFKGFYMEKDKYEEIPKDAKGRMPCRALDLLLAPWHGTYAGVETTWLRWFTYRGEMILTGDEEADEERVKTEAAEARAERLAEKLKALGISPEDI